MKTRLQQSIRRLRLSVILAAALTGTCPGAASARSAERGQAASLCRVPEVALFTCQLKTRTVSICGLQEGRAVYRFGRPGRIELEATDLHRARTGFAGGGETQVYADTPTHRYIVYDQMIRTGFGEDGHLDPRETIGLIVQDKGRTVLSRQCANDATFDPRTQTLVPAGDYVPH